MLIHLTLYRDGREQTLAVTLPPPAEAGLGLSSWTGASVSTALQVLQRTLDPRLGYVLSCRRGLCKVCAMRIDGEVQTACTVPLHDGIRIAPAKASLALLDTVVELSLVRGARAASSSSSTHPEPTLHDT